MISENLFNVALLDPAMNGADRLYIVSGYATAAMSFHHLEALKSLGKRVHINLIVGMCPHDGLSLGNHTAFKNLASVDFPDLFECSYIANSSPVHSKSYSWFRGDEPCYGFVGSANYTQNAFRGNQRELLTQADPKFGFEYFKRLVPDSIFCTHNDVENDIKIYRDTSHHRIEKEQLERQGLSLITPEKLDFQGLPAVRVPLISSVDQEVQKTAGLNWGHRPNRNKNEAYIQLRPEVYNSDFFPIRSIHFTILTDDNKTLICTRAQKNESGHAIETPHNNSLIGEYFRNRLELPSGAFVTKDDLLKHGRTDVDFYKIDDETYFMDFSISTDNDE